MKDLTSFCRHSPLYRSIPACHATVKSGVHVFASLGALGFWDDLGCGKFGLLDSLVPWHGSKIHHLQKKCSTLNWFIIYPTRGKILEESIEFNWPSPRRLFLLAPRLPEVSGIVQCPTVISDEVGCVPTFPNAMEIEWVLKSGFVQHQCGGKSAPSLVTEVKRSHWPQLSPDCYGLRVRDEVSRQRYIQRDRCWGYFLFISSMNL